MRRRGGAVAWAQVRLSSGAQAFLLLPGERLSPNQPPTDRPTAHSLASADDDAHLVRLSLARARSLHSARLAGGSLGGTLDAAFVAQVRL